MGSHLILLAALAAASAGAATPNPKAEALAKRAMTEFDGGNLDAALMDAKAAYALQPTPGLLYNLGQVQRALHHWEEAAAAFRAYLRQRPDAPNRRTVVKLIVETEARWNAEATAPQPGPIPAALAITPSPKPRRTKVAVSELEAGLHADPKLSHLVTTLVTSELRRRPALAVTSQDDIKALLGFERQKALLGCSEASCLAEIGGALGVDQMVTGSLSRAGDTLLLVIRLVDVHRGAVLGDVTRRVAGGSEEALVDAVPGVAAELFPRALPEVAPGATSEAGVLHAHAGRSNAPWWLAGAGAVVALVGGGLFLYEVATKQGLSPATGLYPVTLGAAQTANTIGYAGQATLGVGGAVLAGGALWALLRPAARPEAAAP